MTEVNEPKVKVTLAAAGRLLFQRVMTILVVTVVATVVVYACFAATIIRIVPTFHLQDTIVVKENTFEGGIIPAGELAVVNPNPGEDGEIGTGFGDRLLQGTLFNSNATVVEILAGPHADISWMETGLVQVDRELMDVQVEQPETADGEPKEHLSGEYLVRCVDGACTPGDGLIVSENNFYGLLVDQDYAMVEDDQSTASAQETNTTTKESDA